MIRRWIVALLTASVALAATTANAGGWAIVTLDEVPTNVRAGETIELGFMVRQHGRTPVDVHTWGGHMPVLSATHSESGETVTAEARKIGAEGHYVVSVSFPSAGSWNWQIAPEPFPETRFEPLTVVAAAPSQGASSAGLAALERPILFGGGVALLLAASLLALAARRTARGRALAGQAS